MCHFEMIHFLQTHGRDREGRRLSSGRGKSWTQRPRSPATNHRKINDLIPDVACQAVILRRLCKAAAFVARLA
jgi:hypothetical protein